MREGGISQQLSTIKDNFFIWSPKTKMIQKLYMEQVYSEADRSRETR